MRKTQTKVPGTKRVVRLDLDPYLIQEATWTREDLLRARGMPVRHRPTAHRKAA